MSGKLGSSYFEHPSHRCLFTYGPGSRYMTVLECYDFHDETISS